MDGEAGWRGTGEGSRRGGNSNSWISGTRDVTNTSWRSQERSNDVRTGPPSWRSVETSDSSSNLGEPQPTIGVKEIEVPPGAIPYIIGTNGTRIREIRTIPNVVYVNINNSRSTLVVKYRTSEALQAAEKLLHKFLETASQAKQLEGSGEAEYSPRMRESVTAEPLQTNTRWLKREISLLRGLIPVIIGKRGSFVKQLKDMEGVARAFVDVDRSVLMISCHTEEAMASVEKRVQQTLDIYKPTQEPMGFFVTVDVDKRVEPVLARLLQLPGVISIDRSSLEVTTDSEELTTKVTDILNRFVRDFGFLDDDEIWNHPQNSSSGKRNSQEYFPADFIRDRGTYFNLNHMRSMPGVTNVNLECGENNTYVKLKVGADTEVELEQSLNHIREYYERYLQKLEARVNHSNSQYRRSHHEEVLPFEKILYFPCGAHKKLLNTKQAPEPFFDHLFSEPEVLMIELDITARTIKLACLSQDALRRSMFLTRAQLRAFGGHSWKKRYHSNYRGYIIIPDGLMGHGVRFERMSDGKCTKLSSFLEVFASHENNIYLLNGIKSSPNSHGSNRPVELPSPISFLDKGSIANEFRRFVDFSDFSQLKGLSAQCKIDDLVYRVRSDYHSRRDLDFNQSVHQLLSSWERGFSTKHSNALIIPYSNLHAFLICQFEHMDTKTQFVNLRFGDLLNNRRYVMKYHGTETSEYRDDLCGDLTYEPEHHLVYGTVPIKSFPAFCQRGSIESQYDKEESGNAVDFAREALSTGKAFEDGEMSISNHYSMWDVSFVTRHLYKKGSFVATLEDTRKKTPDSFGKFKETRSLTLFCPKLDSIMASLQTDNENEENKELATRLYLELFEETELITESLSEFIKSILMDRESF